MALLLLWFLSASCNSGSIELLRSDITGIYNEGFIIYPKESEVYGYEYSVITAEGIKPINEFFDIPKDIFVDYIECTYDKVTLNGKKQVYDEVIHIFQPKNGKKFTFDLSRKWFDPRVSPDNRYLVFVSPESDLDIFVYHTLEKKSKNLTNYPSRDVNPIWLSNEEIIFSSNLDGTPNIFMINLRTRKIKNLSKGQGLDSSFSLNESNGKIVFDSDRAGSMDIFIMSIFSNEEIENITNNPATDIEPLMSPDGKKVLFRSDRDSGWDLYMFDIESKQTKRITYSSEMVELGYVWSPDSNSIAFIGLYENRKNDIYNLNINTMKVTNLTNTPESEYTPLHWCK